MTSSSRRARAALAGLALLGLTATTALQQLPATAAEQPSVATSLTDPDSVVTIGDTVAGLADLTSPVDAAGKAVWLAPSAAQRAAARALGSGVSVTWNESGTPASVISSDGVLAPAVPGASAESAARSYLLAHTDLLGLSAQQVEDLEIVGGEGQPLVGSNAEAVLFRQRFGSLSTTTRSMATVGVADDGSIAYLSSSLVKVTDGALPAAVLGLKAGWLKAAAAAGRTVSAVDAGAITTATKLVNGFTSLTVPGFGQPQLVRMRSYVKPDGTVVPVVEANVVDVRGGSSLAYRILVDASSSAGDVLFRQNAVENATNAFPFQGSYTKTTCGPQHPFSITDNTTKTIAAVAAAVVASDDIVIKLTAPGGGPLGAGTYDLGTSPESATYSAPGGASLAQGVYTVQVCAFDGAQMGGPYTANVVLSEVSTATAAPALPQPKWRAFAANPPLSTLSDTKGFTPDNTVIECWFASTAGCSAGEAHQNVFSAGPWDSVNGLPTLTTIGNNANTHEAWANPLAPGGLAQAPYSLTRDYTEKFTDAWNNNKCDPANFVTKDGVPVPGGNDINQVTTNLFTGHNRIHDFAYSLGFTEKNYNLQLDNGGRGGQGGDQEIGNVQAGAITGGSAGMYLGRDNANQIALQDGVPGITNQYLFQPIAGAFYSPCADGALDTGIYGHEYTHAISNRMVGGPDDGLTSDQGGAMGESWSDLNAAEYQFENDYSTGTNPWSLGSYTTGNFAKGIRDYAINDNPLNYSDYGFDTTGAEVHADGEIWNGTLWEVRQALVDAWNARFPYTDKALQDRCATPTSDVTNSQPAASACPGNRRWLQLIFDAWLLQPGATDMLQARNAMLAADRMRFGGENQAVISSAFARRGMGVDASTPTPDSEDVVPSFRSAFGNNSAVTFASSGAGAVYVGDYEARATPVAFTKPSGTQSATSTFTPGIYKMTYVSPTQGFRRFVLTVPDTGAAFTQTIDDGAANLAAAGRGASIITGATTAGSLNVAALIDGTETTNWGVTTTSTVDVAKPGIAVALGGGLQTISSAKVSAYLRPAPASATDLPLLAGKAQDDDPDSGSRFTALRQFALQACTTGCDNPANYTTFFQSAGDAFPGDVPRPVAPDQTMRSFSFAPVQAAAVRLVTLNNQCTGQVKYAGEQDNDPTNSTDCKTASDRGNVVHAAELQVFGGAVPADPAAGTPGSGVPGSGTAGQGTAALPIPGQATLGTPGVTSGATTTQGVPVARLARTHTRIRIPRVEQVRGRESTPLMFSVVAPTTSLGRKAGKVVIKIDGKKVKKTYGIQVTRKAGRKVEGKTFKIPTGLSYGPHRIQVFFKTFDASAFTASKSRTITLTVVSSRPGRG